MTKTLEIEKQQLRQDLPEISTGDEVRVWQKIGEGKEGKERVTPFTGIVIARKHGKGVSATITVRGEISNIAVERIFPIHSPTIKKIEVLTRHKVRRSKLYFLRQRKGKKARLKRKEIQ